MNPRTSGIDDTRNRHQRKHDIIGNQYHDTGGIDRSGKHEHPSTAESENITMKKLLAKIRKLLRDRRTRQIITRFVSITAAIVVFVTTYALVLPAITMESEAYCGIPAHQHSDECYELQLVCGLEESPGHHHDDSCYTVKQVLVCETEEHQHDQDCYDEAGELVCTKAEHTHNADGECYEEERVLTCEEVESEGHQHTEDCYEKVLTCGLEVHTHSTECYVNPASDGATNEAAVEVSSGGASTGAASVDNSDVEYDFEDAGENSNTGATDASENATTALTTVENATAGVTADGHYVPQLNPVNFPTLLDSHTGIYYHSVADGETVEDSTSIPADGWTRVDNDTELGVNDLLRVYLAYTVPAGSLNTTNQVARYRLPGNLHLTDAQVNAINSNVNGIAGQYVDMSTLEILDVDKYNAYLGIEAVEGTRRPDEDPEEYLADVARRTGNEAAEYISALVRVEDVFDEHSGEYEGTDLVVTFTPYSVEKNQHEYDTTGQPIKAGQEIQGWLTLDFNLSQADWDETTVDTFKREVETEEADDHSVEEQTVDDEAEEAEEAGSAAVTVETVERIEKTADVVFVAEDRDEKNHKIDEISTKLTVVEETVVGTQTVEDQGENAGEGATEDAVAATTEEAAVDDQEQANTGETSDESTTGETSAPAEEDKSDAAENAEPVVIMPAMSFNDKITVRTGKPADIETNAGGTLANAAESLPEEAEVTVRVEADEGTFPAGTTMVLKAVDQKTLDGLADTLAETVENPTDVAASSESASSAETTDSSDNEKAEETEQTDSTDAAVDDHSEANEQSEQTVETEKPTEQQTETTENNTEGEKKESNLKTYGFQAVDITFVDAEGNEVEPAKLVRVALTSETVEQAKKEAENSSVVDPVVVHVDDEGNAEQMDLVAPEEIEPAVGRSEEEIERDLEAEKAAGSDVSDVNDEADTEGSDTTDTASTADAVETDTAANNDGAASDTTVDNDAAKNDDAVSDATVDDHTVDNDVEASETDNTYEDAQTNTGDGGNADADVTDAATDSSTVGFTTDSFSVYAIVYTVDFHYDVDGKTYDYSINGGDVIGLKELLPILNVITDDEATENVDEVQTFINDIESVQFSDESLVKVARSETDTTAGQLKEKIKNETGAEPEYSGELTEEQIAEMDAKELAAPDWALVSMKAFDTEETLTVTMKSGEVFEIRVTDVMDDTVPYDKGTTFTAYDTREDGFVINLFDYGPETTSDSKGLDNGGTNLQDKSGGYNSGINYNHTLKFTAYGKKPSEVKTNGQNVLTWNHFSGTDAATQGIVENKLVSNYPKLNGGESLAYLFNTTADGNNKKVYTNVSGLFQKDEDGKYYYDSNVNYAYYNPSQGNGGNFQLCDTFPEEGSDWGVGFFPFNEWNGTKNCIHWPEWCPGTSSSNNNYYYNHHFGVTLDGSFQMTPSGKLNGKDMVFNFSGDDDLWVFIDDVLVLDIGGIHNPVGGSINFRTGDVKVNSAYNVNAVIDDSVSGPAATTTIAARFAAAGKTWDPSPYSEHTIKVFYVERGGCYSNCAMEFNLTRFKEIEFDKKDQYGDAVENAEFRLYKEDNSPLMETYIDDNGDFQEKPYVRYSDANGHVKFDYVPVGTYYLKEVTVPTGYIAESSSYDAKITVTNNGNGTYTVNSYTLKGGQQTSTLLNYKNRDIELSLEKKWPGGAPNGATATFVLQRRRSYDGNVQTTQTVEGGPDYSLKVYKYYNGNYSNYQDQIQMITQLDLVRGQTVNVSWSKGDWNNETRYRIGTNGSWTNGTSVSNVNIPTDGSTVEIYVFDGAYYTDHGVNNVTSTGQTGAKLTVTQTTTTHISATNEEDTNFNNNNPPSHTFPAGTTDWTYTFPAQDAIGLRADGLLETYTYYIKEVPPLPTGYEVVYDRMDGDKIAGSTDSETRTIINVKLTNIPVQKSWDWSDNDDDHIASWSAKFKLQYREVYESGTPDDPQNIQSLWSYVYDGANVKEITITSTSDTGASSFDNLPMYKIHANGSVYRLKYAVEESEYTINYTDGRAPTTWSRNSGGTFDEHYSPIYEEDAGQTSDSYSISVTNAPSEEREQNNISMELEKIWEDENGNTISDTSGYSAKFKLMRFYHEEYLDLTDYNENNLVTITLDFGNGKKSMLEVPSGAPVFITTDVKSEGSVDLTFNQTVPSGSSQSRRLYYNHNNLTVGHYTHTDGTDGPVVFVFSDPITASQNETWTLQTPSGSEPFKYVLGGDEGIRPATFDYDLDGSEIVPDVTGEIPDTSFTSNDPLGKEFELNSGNRWKKSWDKLPQVVEVKTATKGDSGAAGTFLTTIVYSYYFEEVECNPSDYYAVFRDHNSGERYGDITARVEASGLTIDAINKPAPETQLYKVDIGKLGGAINPATDLLTGASFQIKKYVKFTDPVSGQEDQEGGQQGGQQPHEVEQLDTNWGTNGVKTATYADYDPDTPNLLLDNGKFKVDGLVPGYYEIVEIDYPDGYIQLTNNPRFQVKLNLETETETLEIVPWNSDDPIDVIDANGETPNIIVVGNEPGAELPSCGGPGTRLIYLAGALLTLAAGLLLMHRGKRIRT